MATRTPIQNPRCAEQEAQFYTYRATFTQLDDDGNQAATSLPDSIHCAYMPDAGAEVEGFRAEQSTEDRILIPQWLPGIQTKWYVTLALANGTPFKRFTISDVMPNDPSQSATLLTVSAA